ncbi:MAG: Prochlorococcus phage, partial [Actinomycetota bacterium]
MVQGFESRIKIQEIIDNQLPEFVLDESPKLSEFLKQYYISQEYQGGPVDILENLDQYIKFDNLTPEVVVGTTTLSENISSSDDIIKVTTTKGFPQKYGLIKIDDEIITYTGITTNTFTGCVRGFSGITNYQRELNYEELVFSTSESSNHTASSTVENLSVLFLKEFYKKIKYTLLPELQNKEFVSNLNVGNFIKEVKTLYQTKGTEESFRILFNVLFGETPKVIDHEKFLIKPSASTFIRREIVVADAISGNPFKLAGQTIFKSNDINTSASVSEVEIIQRKGKTYYKLFLFIGFSDYFPTVSGTFNITGNTKVLNSVSIGSSVISVDSTIGFPNSGKLYTENNIIEYTDKSINQFFGCSGIVSNIETSSIIYSEDTYYGYEDGDLSKKVEFRLTGVLSNYESKDLDSPVSVGEKITIKNIGEIINNPIENKTYKEIFANSWVYNTSSRFEIESFSSGQISQFVLKSEIDKSNLKVGDYIEILYKDSQDVIESNLRISSIDNRQINTFESFTLSQNFNYDIRRKIKNANSSVVPLEFVPIISEVQNVYNENDDYMYVASNSLPSYQITKNVFSYNAIGVDEVSSETGLYSRITFSQRVSFITGSEVYYTPSNTPIFGLSEGVYYVEVLPGELQIKLYSSRSVIGTVNYLSFGNLTEGSHNFRLNSQKERFISPQKILRKFPLSVNNYGSKSSVTDPGATGILINGVEIFNYKSSDKIYYGGIESVRVLNGGKNYDVINPPLLSLSSGDALVQPVVSGSIEKIYVDPQDFDIDVVVSVSLSGGNGSGSSFEPVVERRVREIEFDARQLTEGGGVDIINETITFTSNHGLIDGQPIVYRSENNPLLGIGNFNGNNSNTGFILKNGAT